MKCWQDDYEVGVIGTEHRYCSQCGARLFQVCPYCGQGVSVYESNCPHCQRPFLYCPACHVLYRVNQPRCDNDGCKQPLAESILAFHAPLTTLARTNVVPASRLPDGSVQGLFLDNGLPISAVVTRHGWLFFGTRTAQGSSARLRAVSATTGSDVWPGSPLRNVPLWETAPVAYQQFVVARVGRVLLVDDVLMGTEVARVEPPLQDFQEALIRNSLLVLGKDAQNNQRLLIYTVPMPSSFQPFSIDLGDAPSQRSPSALPVVTADSAYFVDFQSRVIRCQPTRDPLPIWGNPNRHIITQLALDGDELFLLIHDQQGSALMSITLDGDGRASQPPILRLSRLSLALPKLALHRDLVIVANPDSIRAYQLSRPTQPLWEHRLVANSAIADFFAVSDEERRFVVYLLRQNQPNQFSVRWAQVEHSTAGGSPQLLRSNSNPWICYANGCVLACERKQGRIYRVHLGA